CKGRARETTARRNATSDQRGLRSSRLSEPEPLHKDLQINHRRNSAHIPGSRRRLNSLNKSGFGNQSPKVSKKVEDRRSAFWFNPTVTSCAQNPALMKGSK